MDLWKGTFLADVEAIAMAGKFVEPDGDVTEGEEVIGEMTIGEKALYAFCDMAFKDLRRATAQFVSTLIESGQRDPALNARGAKMSGQLNAAKTLMWRVIEDRLALPSGNIGIRKGYQIIKTPDHTDQEPCASLPGLIVLDLLIPRG